MTMIDFSLRRSPLAHRGLIARAASDAAAREAGVTLGEQPHRCQINLRGDAGDSGFLAAVEDVTGLRLPVEPNTVATVEDLSALWLGPDEWLIVGPGGREGDLTGGLRGALEGRHFAVTDVSEARTVIAISGPHARDLLAKGTSLDLHPRVFGPGRCAQSGIAKATMILHQLDANGDGADGAGADEQPTFEIYIANSFADYLWTWLERAAAEYRVAVTAG
ncbi:sarcosine oxidase subunit gamma [Virgifigura deserti]|uniref:sarcosine oxidase subunit gamma n=1 Tax=Virgifigura deserti TaxID=2268457 RepID=UPI003CCBF7F2